MATRGEGPARGEEPRARSRVPPPAPPAGTRGHSPVPRPRPSAWRCPSHHRRPFPGAAGATPLVPAPPHSRAPARLGGGDSQTVTAPGERAGGPFSGRFPGASAPAVPGGGGPAGGARAARTLRDPDGSRPRRRQPPRHPRSGRRRRGRVSVGRRCPAAGKHSPERATHRERPAGAEEGSGVAPGLCLGLPARTHLNVPDVLAMAALVQPAWTPVAHSAQPRVPQNCLPRGLSLRGRRWLEVPAGCGQGSPGTPRDLRGFLPLPRGLYPRLPPWRWPWHPSRPGWGQKRALRVAAGSCGVPGSG